MLRYLQVNEKKPLALMKAGAAMKKGAAIVKDYTDGTVDNATATDGIFLVDKANNYDGINAIIPQNDGGYEDIKEGEIVITIPLYVGERYATSELTVGSLNVGDLLKASAGKFVAGTTNDVCNFVYQGEYDDPCGIKLYIVEVVAPTKITE